MTVLITGATGFIGSNIVECLLAEGRDVVAFSNRNVPDALAHTWASLPGAIHYAVGDVRNAPLLADIIRQYGVDKVVHGAVVTSDAQREHTAGDVVIDVNLVGSARVAMAAAQHGVERFVLIGSAGVYNESEVDGGTILTEDDHHRVSTLYAVSKAAAEPVIARICQLHGISYVIGRIGTAFGPWEHNTGFRDTLSPIFQVTQIALNGGKAILPQPKRKNWHYSRDAARSLVTLLDARAPEHDTYNLGSPFVWSIADWCERLKRQFPRFDFAFNGDGTRVDLYGDSDGGLLSWDRFTNEFGATAQFDLDRAFADYMHWLTHQAGAKPLAASAADMGVR